ncbi:Endoribonuclease L-PSP [Polyplosphaeria fusca]|uniref:Endoribonuclease L-PSP n=1 Tax=Polyplosphaeria fusca TaxID=682080 RepID=A0A9P4V0Q8_9PLEO|nr:Endoribonuclease L-PSP [Polyplosphaeria fusca]
MTSSRKEVIWSDVPKLLPVMPFVPAVKCGDMVYLSGNIGIEWKTNKLVEGDIKERTRVIMRNIAKLLEDAGSHLNYIVKANVYLKDMKDFGAVNEAYLEFFPEEKDRPARTCVQVAGLPFDTDVEIECTAHV